MALSAPFTRTPASPRTTAEQVRYRPHLALPYWLSGSLALLLVVASTAGLFAPGLYRDTPRWVATTRGTDLVTLLVAVPALAASLILAARGSLRAHIVLLGVLAYVLYTYAIYAFDVAFNPLFLVYVAALALSLYALVALLVRMDPDGLRACFAPGLPIRGIAVYLLVVAALFGLAWLKDIVPAMVGNTTPTSLTGMKLPTNPVHVLDLGILLPLVALSGIWLWRRQSWGYLLAGILLTKMTVLGVSVVAGALFEHNADPTASLGVVPLFVAVTLVGLWLMIAYLRNLRGGPVSRVH